MLATPSYRSAALLHDTAPLLSDLLRSIQYASVAIVRISYDASTVGVPLDASGFVIPAVEHKLLTACSWSSAKWKDLATPDTVIVRASIGRFGDDRALRLTDDDLVERAHEELIDMMKLSGGILEADVTRWADAFPQYEPGHAARVALIQAAATGVEGLALAGAAYDGLGVPACIRSGSAAASALRPRFQTIKSPLKRQAGVTPRGIYYSIRSVFKCRSNQVASDFLRLTSKTGSDDRRVRFSCRKATKTKLGFGPMRMKSTPRDENLAGDQPGMPDRPSSAGSSSNTSGL